MSAADSLPTDKTSSWTLFQKILFRFFFIYFSLYTWFGNNILIHIFYPRFTQFLVHVSIFVKPLYWLDKHLYHIGYHADVNPKISSKDSPVVWVIFITILWLSIICCALWSIADKKRKNYNKLNYWFTAYLAYYLFVIMDYYAVYKILAVQMPFPNAGFLLEPFGNQSRFFLLFNLVGLSPGYSIFTGVCELLASVLVLNRRTRVFGCLCMIAVLLNVLCFNIFYNVIVKLLTINLLLITLYILAPYTVKLFKFFYSHEPASLAQKKYTFVTPWKRYVIMLLSVIPVWVTINLISRGLKQSKLHEMQQQQKIYDVVKFVRGADTLPPLLTDTFQIRRLLFTTYFGRRYAIVYNMKDNPRYYNYSWDKKTNHITMTGKMDTNDKAQFHYEEHTDTLLKLDGTWHKQKVSMFLKKFNLDSLPVVKEKIKWVVPE